ncbi:MAG: xanthine dehydrogenase family protein molybdopterin-binding subunit [Proteobacteria bacterium]|nr:xanthine dehydrogenase family protein molybdopterin-binding subunit [Pseudomonadota bacterium]
MAEIGKPVRRIEDFRLLTGGGRFTDDLSRPQQAHGHVLRATCAHAVIRNIDANAARRMPGVLAVLSGADFLADGLAPLRHRGNPKDVELKNADGSPIVTTPVYPLAVDRVRRVGEPVALIVAETAQQARDAAEVVEPDFELLDAVASPAAAMAAGAPRIWDDVPGNLSVHDVKGDAVAVDAAFARAAHVARFSTFNNRVTGVPMEPRAAIGEYDPVTGRYTLTAGGQGVMRFQMELAPVFGVAADRIRVVSHDTGGGYGTRNSTYPEFALVLWAARRVGRPVKWVSDRSESFLNDYSGRNMHTRAELELDKEGRFLALRTETIADLGSHAISYVPLAWGATVTTGAYAIPAMHVVSKAVLTNTIPTTAYRGAGRPEANFVIERLIDIAAAETGIDRVALRRRNLIPATAFPYDAQMGCIYDSGEFERGMDMALERGDWDGFTARRAESLSRGMLRGIGLANYVETAAGWPMERAEMAVLPDGRIDIVIGTQASGQGHETAYAQVVADFLQVPTESVVLRTGDTDFVKMGAGSHSSRSMRLAGHLFRQNADAIIEKGRRIASQLLEAAVEDVEFADGGFRVAGTDRRIGLFETAAQAVGLADPLRSIAEVTQSIHAFPNGSHVVEVEVDPDTGAVRIMRYTAIDDVGRVINPMIVDGQTHGGIAQGAGQALLENKLYDPDTAQLISGSFMDYALPRADDLPFFDLEFNEVPAPSTWLGVKGGGEGGATGAPNAIISAIIDAISGYGVRHIEMPATPEKIWKAMRRHHT